MRAQFLVGAALCVQFGLAIVIPDRGAHAHNGRHDKRAIATAIVTETDFVTVTDTNAVLVVDQKNQVSRTDFKDVSTSAVSASATASSTSVSSAVSSSAGSDSASDMRLAPGTATAESSSTLSTPSATSVSSSNTIPVTSAVSAAKGGSNSAAIAGDLGHFSIDYDVSNGPQGGATYCRDFNTDFAYLKGMNVSFIRTYGPSCMTDVVNAAAAQGLSLMVGLIDITDDINQIINSVKASSAGWGPIQTIYIGNEVVNRGGSAAAVAAAVSSARGVLQANGYNGNVITVDTFNSFNDPTLCSTSTFCGVNAHAYFSGVSADQAGTFLRTTYNNVLAVNGNKHTVITETGWPYRGSANGQAVPSPQNQVTAMNAIMSEFAGSASDVFLFQAYDTTYKNPGSLGVEQYFGLFNSDSGGL